MRTPSFLTAILPVFGLLVGCTTPFNDGDAPEADDSELGELALVTANGSWGSWTIDAKKPTPEAFGKLVRGSAVFTRVSGATTAPGGVCLAVQSHTGMTCSVDSDCNGIEVPAGGWRYCRFGTCFVRPGSTVDYCTGFPANQTNVGEGTTYTPTVWSAYHEDGQMETWLSIGCIGPTTCSTSVTHYYQP